MVRIAELSSTRLADVRDGRVSDSISRSATVEIAARLAAFVLAGCGLVRLGVHDSARGAVGDKRNNEGLNDS